MCLGSDRTTFHFALRRATLGPFRRRGGTRGQTCLRRDTAASSRSSCGVGHRRAPDAWATRRTWMRRSARQCDRRTASPRSRSRGSASRHRPRGRTAQAHEQRLRGPLDPPRTEEAATQRILGAECSGQRKMCSDCPDPRRALPGSNSPSEGASRRCACRLPSVACRRLAREVDDAPIGVARIVSAPCLAAGCWIRDRQRTSCGSNRRHAHRSGCTLQVVAARSADATCVG